jgi:hypothetical protein
VAGVPARPLTVRLTLDAQPVASTTRLIELGGYHVAVSTVVLGPQLPLELHSSYLGHPDTATRATHLTIAPGHADTHVMEHDQSQLPVTHARERCLLDHLQVLIELATELGHTLGVELPKRALV